jgi:hypothetical protein
MTNAARGFYRPLAFFVTGQWSVINVKSAVADQVALPIFILS